MKSIFYVLTCLFSIALARPAPAATFDFEGVVDQCNALACSLAGIAIGEPIAGFLKAIDAFAGPNSTFGAADITDYAIAAQGVAVGPADSTIVSASVTTDAAGEPTSGSILFFGEFDSGIGIVALDVTIDFTTGQWAVETDFLGIGLVASGPGTWTREPDGDDLAAIEDNCTEVANATQLDTDGDGIGNFCDPDFDQNCSVNFADLSVMSSNFFVPGNLVTDLDGSGLTNFGDLGILSQFFFSVPGPSGVPNVCSP